MGGFLGLSIASGRMPPAKLNRRAERRPTTVTAATSLRILKFTNPCSTESPHLPISEKRNIVFCESPNPQISESWSLRTPPSELRKFR